MQKSGFVLIRLSYLGVTTVVFFRLIRLLVESLMYSRGFCLLIRVFIYQNAHLDKYISKMVVANFF